MSGVEGPRLCVVLPTRNRREWAIAALESVVGQLRPDDELIAVDNGSSDGTAEALRAWLPQRRPSGRVVVEAERGLSHARNAALREATAPIICFIDDDERADPGWIAALRTAWSEAEPRVGAIGGPMRADWRAPRPAWLADWLLYVLSILDLGPDRRRLCQTPDGRGYLWGGNMSFRTEVVRASGGFRPDEAYLAAVSDGQPSGRRLLATAHSGEEQELQRRFARAGWEVWYEPAAAVDHLVPAERLTEEYFRTFFRQRGLLEAARGGGRARGLALLARSGARYGLLRTLRRPEAETAKFEWVYAWTLLTAPRRGAPAPRPGREAVARKARRL